MLTKTTTRQTSTCYIPCPPISPMTKQHAPKECSFLRLADISPITTSQGDGNQAAHGVSSLLLPDAWPAHLKQFARQQTSTLTSTKQDPKHIQANNVQKPPKAFQNHESTDIGKKRNASVCLDLRRDIAQSHAWTM